MFPADILGYRLEVQPGEFHFMLAGEYDLMHNKEGYRTWSLHKLPVLKCPTDVAVYRGRYWLQPKHVYRNRAKLEQFTPLFLGPIVNETKFQEKELYEYPGIIEMKLKHDFPHLYV